MNIYSDLVEESEFSDHITTRSLEIITEMTLKEKVGQMFIAQRPSTDSVQKASDWALGGYLLFAYDFSGLSKSEVIANIQSYQHASRINMFIAVDEEGGTVNRVSRNSALRSSPFLSPQQLFELGGFDLIAEDTVEKSELLSSLGINLNLAPVADVSTDNQSFIYPRAFGQDAEITAKYVRTVVNVMKEMGMGSALKHFPGYGDSFDTHFVAAHDNRPLEAFYSGDFIPFIAGIEVGADMIMVSHVIVESIDPNLPASLSPEVNRILRKDLGFDGVIITDDLAMGAIGQFVSDYSIAVLAVLAGNDMIITADFEGQIMDILAAVEDGVISESMIDEAVFRIIRLKIQLGIVY
ncbi:MAG: beta-hexosaminidase [Defluviitaleaceae bacterium]|nr:beta-hexosaminidase [Defluviitaleaceae bacterium]